MIDFLRFPISLESRPRRADRLASLSAEIVVLSLLVATGFAQHTLPVPQSAKSTTLAADTVVSRRFLAVPGQRAVIQGYTSEGLEIWAYPFQILTNYRVAFLPAGATTAIEGSSILTRVVYEPEAVTRIYLGPGFTVRERLFVPLDRAGAILTYFVQSEHPIEIEIHALPVLNLMWPAAVGGQSVEWHSSLGAFVLAEPADGFTAVVGSPQMAAHDSPDNRTAHGVADTGFGFTLRPTSTGVAEVIVALNPPHTDDPGRLFHELIRNSETLQSDAATRLSDLRNELLEVETPDDRVNQAIAWAEIALHQAWVCNPDLGCGYIAGYGPSRGARRPQYEWFFAGDGLVAADAAIAAADRAHVRDELEFILRYQDKKTGMIWHELSQSAGFLDWAGKFPYMYVHVDTTFQFLGSVARYVAASGDTAFVNQHWDALESAYRYCLSIIDPAIGLPRIPLGKEAGDEQDRMSDDLGLSASWVTAASAFAQMATLTGHADLTAEASRASKRARKTIPQRYWDQSQSFWIGGRTLAGQPMAERWSGPAEALTLHLYSTQQNSLLLDQLAAASFQTDWGTRSIAAGSAGFDPDSYGKGSVWPLGTAGMVQAFWSEHRPVTALQVWCSMLPLSWLDSPGHMPEVLAGTVYRPQIESVPEQTWSSAGFLEATIQGLLGLEVDAIANRIVFAPRPPAEWAGVSLSHIHLAAASVSLALHRDGTGLSLDIDNSGPPFTLDFQPDISLGATLQRAALNQHPVAAMIERYPQQADAKVVFEAPQGKSQLRLDLEGGVSVIPDTPSPLLGESSVGVKIIDVHFEANRLSIAADVPADRTSHLRLKTNWNIATSSGVTVETIAPGIVELTFSATPNAASSYRRALAVIEFQP